MAHGTSGRHRHLQYAEQEAHPRDANCKSLAAHDMPGLLLIAMQKEKEFYARIKKFRVDPSASSMANPVPDYYGEKISSVKDYRQWLKDQRAFNKKRTTYVKL